MGLSSGFGGFERGCCPGFQGHNTNYRDCEKIKKKEKKRRKGTLETDSLFYVFLDKAHCTSSQRQDTWWVERTVPPFRINKGVPHDSTSRIPIASWPSNYNLRSQAKAPGVEEELAPVEQVNSSTHIFFKHGQCVKTGKVPLRWYTKC